MGQRRIGILTSGGDCAGLNAVIRAIVHRAVCTYDWEVVGICRATQGLMARPLDVMVLDFHQTDRHYRHRRRWQHGDFAQGAQHSADKLSTHRQTIARTLRPQPSGTHRQTIARMPRPQPSGS